MKSKRTMGRKLNRIKEVLDTKGIKYSWLAYQMGKSLPTMSNWVNNLKQPSLDQVVTMAEILEVPPLELVSLG